LFAHELIYFIGVGELTAKRQFCSPKDKYRAIYLLGVHEPKYYDLAPFPFGA
jgi:hypothetical protein